MVILNKMKKIISILLAVLMLASNVGFAVNIHYCGGEAVEHSLSVGIEHLDCGMANDDMECSNADAENSEFHPQSCCDNQHQLFQLDEEMELGSRHLAVSQTFFIAFIHSFVSGLFAVDKLSTEYLNYSPPLLERDAQSLFQTFLI